MSFKYEIRRESDVESEYKKKCIINFWNWVKKYNIKNLVYVKLYCKNVMLYFILWIIFL